MSEVCQHESITSSGFIYEDGHMVECDETCDDCGKEWVWSYGSLEEK